MELMNVGVWMMRDEETALPVNVRGIPIAQRFCHVRIIETCLQVVLIVGVHKILHLLHQVLGDCMVLYL